MSGLNATVVAFPLVIRFTSQEPPALRISPTKTPSFLHSTRSAPKKSASHVITSPLSCPPFWRRAHQASPHCYSSAVQDRKKSSSCLALQIINRHLRNGFPFAGWFV